MFGEGVAVPFVPVTVKVALFEPPDVAPPNIATSISLPLDVNVMVPELLGVETLSWVVPTILQADGIGVGVGGIGVAVGGIGVAVGGIGVAVGGIGVAVGGIGVAVGGNGVAVGGIGVAVGKPGILLIGIHCTTSVQVAPNAIALIDLAASGILFTVKPEVGNDETNTLSKPGISTQDEQSALHDCNFTFKIDCPVVPNLSDAEIAIFYKYFLFFSFIFCYPQDK